MIVDTSAVLAVLFRESDAEQYATAILTAAPCRMSVASLLEASIVIGSRGTAAGAELDAFVDEAEIELMPVTLEQVEVARDAWRRYGKGRHAAALNFGDCFAYALARTMGEPLLFKGDDFLLTDIERAAD